ncbi:MAG: hypothetical protein RB191_16095 [Terriglobia bacterium]|nr:hypothetical protein [Terriglobia bacterium]
MRATIDVTKPSALYVGLAVFLQIAAILLPRLGLSAGTEFVHFPYQRSAAIACLGLSVLFGLLGASRHAARAEQPWRVPQSQALICVLLFAILGALGLVLSLGA